MDKSLPFDDSVILTTDVIHGREWIHVFNGEQLIDNGGVRWHGDNITFIHSLQVY